MNAIVIYDSLYGNTERVARTIGSVLQATVLPVTKVFVWNLNEHDTIIVGSPVHGGRATPAIDSFLKSIPDGLLKDKKVAAFDTRFDPQEHGAGLRILMAVIRFAAERIARDLKNKGGILVAEPVGFIVEDKKGPLKDGELRRAQEWAKEVMAK